MSYRAGEFAGNYQVLQLLGRGTFGEVALARDPSRPHHLVALKTVSCDQLTTEAAERIRKAALAEAQLLQRLRHPHIVKCEEVQWDPYRHVVWLALEFMDGGDAQNLAEKRRQELGGQPFEAHFLRRVLASVGSALRYIHSQGVLHRDVKPANMLLTRRSQRIKLGDFGISKLLEETPLAHTVVGTPYYLAPEIVSGLAYGPAADAWALGVCLYEFAALKRPFEAGNPLALVRRICEEPPADLPPETAADINNAVMGLLEREPQQRLSLPHALAVSAAVVALVAAPAEDESLHVTGGPAMFHSLEEINTELAPQSQAPCSPSDLSPVSVATSAWASTQGEENAAELVASLCGRQPQQHEVQRRRRRAVPESWATAGHSMTVLPLSGSDAVTKARVALGADVDDPQELQHALCVLEVEALEASESWADVYESLRCELRLRIAALRADAAALLESLLDPQQEHHEYTIERTALVASSRVVRESVPDTVTTMGFVVTATCSAEPGGEVAALESAIEVATSLGVDTEPAEEKAASARGLLSIRVVWGKFTKFCLVPLGITFAELISEVARRFGLPENLSSPGSNLELCYRDGAEVFFVRDQASWDCCLRRRGLSFRPGRLELRLEAVASLTPAPQPRRASDPVVTEAFDMPCVTGIRLAPPSSTPDPPSVVRAITRTGVVANRLSLPTVTRSSSERNRPAQTAATGRSPASQLSRNGRQGSSLGPAPGPMAGISGGPVPGTAAFAAGAGGNSARGAQRQNSLPAQRRSLPSRQARLPSKGELPPRASIRREFERREKAGGG